MSAPAARQPSGPLRRIYKVLYWTISLNLMLSTAVGVTVHVFRDPEGNAPQIPEGTTPDSPEGRACRAELGGHYRALQARLTPALTREASPTLAHDWQDFTQAWRAELDRTRHRCRLDSPAMAPLAAIARDLEKLRVSYTTAVHGYANNGQPTLLRLEAAFSPPSAGGAAFPPSRPE